MWGALFSDYMSLLLSNDIISELKSLLHDYDDALAGPEKPACRTGLAWPGWGDGGLAIDLVRISIVRVEESQK